VQDKGEFASRGGIVDLFSVTSSEPVRVEFWGDEIVSLRTFDPLSQKTILEIREVSVPLSDEMNLLESTETTTIFEFIPNALMFLMNPMKLRSVGLILRRKSKQIPLIFSH
jgi:Transcription-repair coupling factor (superfamily II helicase)